MDLKIKNLVRTNHDWVVALRRHFHAHPEPSEQEYKTQCKIISELEALGLNPYKAAETGVIADIKGSKPGKTIALRADIDALELEDQCGQPYQSVNPGICHACAHDGHTAILLGTAKVLLQLKDSLNGNIRLLFQPSEEVFPGGAQKLVNEGALNGVEAIAGLHLWQPLRVGTIGIAHGAVMASPDEFIINIKGMGGHGGMPHQAIDALLAAAQVVVALNSIVSRNVDPLQHAALSIGVLKSGEMSNIVADTAVIKGTVRTFDDSVKRLIFKRIEEVTYGICQAAGVSCSIDKFFGFPPVVNHSDLAKLATRVAAETVGAENVLDIKPSMVAEDFSVYQQKVPGVFMLVGAGNPDKGIIYPHHHPKFDIDERALSYGVDLLARTAIKMLS